MIHRFCVTHMEPLLPEDWYDDCLAMGDFQPDSRFHVKHLDSFWHEARPLAYGAAGTHVLPIAMEELPSHIELIEISSFRKRVLPSREGIESRIYPTMREVPREGLAAEVELSVFTPPKDLGFLVPQPLYLKNSMLGHYTICHRRKDILDYTTIAVEAGVLDKDSAAEFLSSKHFIPGGVELGVYPKVFLADALSKIERVSRRFLIRYSDRLKKYDAYQIRAVGFLSERLGSFLLMRHLTEVHGKNIPESIFGHMTAIVEEDATYTVGLVEQPKKRLARLKLKDDRAG